MLSSSCADNVTESIYTIISACHPCWNPEYKVLLVHDGFQHPFSAHAMIPHRARRMSLFFAGLQFSFETSGKRAQVNRGYVEGNYLPVRRYRSITIVAVILRALHEQI